MSTTKLIGSLSWNAPVLLSTISTGADPGFDQGGVPDRDRPKLPMVRSSVVRAK